MGTALDIRDDLSPCELRRWARREARGRPAARAYAISNALEGTSRAEAARLAGMDRQALRDAVVRYNAEGLAGLNDRPKGHPPRRLTEGEEAALAAVILEGPDPERDGVCAWTRADLCRWLEANFAKPPFQPDPGAATAGLLAAKGAPGAPAKRRRSAAALQKGSSARP